MMNNGVDNMRIAKIISEIDGTFLSSVKITNLYKEEKKIKKKTRIAESEELREYMNSIGGKFISDGTIKEGGNEIKRKIVVTFTTEEFKNLEKFGDFLSVDPTLKMRRLPNLYRAVLGPNPPIGQILAQGQILNNFTFHTTK